MLSGTSLSPAAGCQETRVTGAPCSSSASAKRSAPTLAMRRGERNRSGYSVMRTLLCLRNTALINHQRGGDNRCGLVTFKYQRARCLEPGALRREALGVSLVAAEGDNHR